MLQQQEREIDDAVLKAQAESIERCANENQVPLKELEDKLQPIVDSCTKDSIQNGNYISSFLRISFQTQERARRMLKMAKLFIQR